MQISTLSFMTAKTHVAYRRQRKAGFQEIQMSEFKEPKPNQLVIGFFRLVFPLWLKYRERLSIEVRGRKELLDAVKQHKRAVILLNHPDRQDPFALFKLADYLNQQFYVIVARECFDWDNGWRGWLFQSLGCYSVARGKADFHSISRTKKILMEAQKKLVVFPEAEITADYEELHHMQKAIFHIVLDVQDDLNKKDKNSIKGEAPVVLIPAAIKFSLEDSLDIAVSPAVKEIGKRLGIKHDKSKNIVEQIDAVIDAYLSKVFSSYGLQRPEGSLENLSELAGKEILERISINQNVEPEESISLIEKLYFVRNHVEGDLEIDSVATNPKAFHCAGLPKPSLRSDFERIERLLILQRMLLHREKPIQNCRILDFIESEVTGLITPKGRQSCVISPGEAIDVSPFVEEYTQNKLSAVRKLREVFMEKLQEKLDSLLQQSQE